MITRMRIIRNVRVSLIRPILGLLVLWLSFGCSSFDKAWREAAEQSHPADHLSGAWSGEWKSEINGHNGKLRCVITAQKDNVYKARFHATYKKVLTFGYTVPLRVTETNSGFRFAGDANLGWYAGGTYTYEGHADRTNFYSTYRCNYDQGTFQMTKAAHLAIQTAVTKGP